MTNADVVMPDDLAVGMVAATGSSLHFSYPPPRAAGVGFANYKRLLSQLEVSGINAWIESMKASSPTQLRSSPASSSVTDEGRDEWMKEHPSALSNFHEIAEASEGKQIVMFLDYDGTLSPIVDNPDRAFMSDSMRGAVRDVAVHFPTAIVSGRCRDKVYNFVRLRELYYAGSHGMDIKVPHKHRGPKRAKAKVKAVVFQPASEFVPMIEEVYEALAEGTRSIEGSRVENNKFCLSVHFRCVDEKKWSSLAELVRSVIKDYPKLRLTQGRKVLEIRPNIKWDKGKALQFLLESLGFGDHDDVLPVYIGDDRTDEDAFKVLRDRGQGFGILVSKFSRETNASYSLTDPAQVMEFLTRLVEWKRL